MITSFLIIVIMGHVYFMNIEQKYNYEIMVGYIRTLLIGFLFESLEGLSVLMKRKLDHGSVQLDLLFILVWIKV